LGKLYTRSGDDGFTYGLAGVRIPKSHPLIEFYGALDEANSMLGLARSLLARDMPEYDDDLRFFQLLLFRIGFSVTARDPRVSEDDVRRLEEIVDKYYGEPLRAFIIPGGPPGVAALHVARSYVRRAERRLVALKVEGHLDFDTVLIKALNRLSDAIFALALHASRRAGFEPERVPP
jgi:cob(I)alamin adenosyltransferase